MDGTKSLVSNGELIIYGVIDPLSFFDESVRAIDVIDSIAKLPPGEIKVRINSPGGSLTEGVAIYNALKGAGRRVRVQVDAMAASAASIVAMAGEEIVMADGATMMIHDPYAALMGDAEDLRKFADVLDMQRDQMIGIYAARTGLPADEIAELMKAETYMNAQEAVQRGFATSIAEPMRIAACALLSKKDMTRLLLASPTIRADGSNPAAPAAPQRKETDMPPAVTDTGGGNAPDLNAIRAEAITAERTRAHAIGAAVRAAKLMPEFADELIRTGASIEDARAKIIDKFAETNAAAAGGDEPTYPRAEITGDGVERFNRGATLGLMARAGLLKPEEKKDAGSNEFAGLSMAELARASLSVRNIKSGHMSRMSMVGAAFTTRAAGTGLSLQF